MRHLDEGTIHAWLDGAASAEASRDIEAHIATCDACAAMVAEARGFIAGASRILTGLDHVPAGVIPRGAPAGRIPGADMPPFGRPRARWWTRSSALRAAAVLLILGGGTVAVLQQLPGNGLELVEPRESEPILLESSAPAAGSAEESRDAARRDGQGAAARESSAQSATAPTASDEAPRARVAPGAHVPGLTGQGADARRRAMGGAEVRTGGDRPPAAADEGARKAAVPPPPTPAAAPTTARTESVVAANQERRREPAAVGATGAVARAQIDSAVVSRFAAERERAVRDTTARVSAPASDMVIRQEARRFPDSAGSLRLSEVVVTGVQAIPGVELAGCYAITLAPWSPPGDEGARSPALPPVLTLDARMLEVARDGPRMALRVPGDTAQPMPAGSYWRLAGRDSLVIVWRSTNPETTIRLGGGDATRTGVAEQAGRRASVTAERMGDQCVVRNGEGPEPPK